MKSPGPLICPILRQALFQDFPGQNQNQGNVFFLLARFLRDIGEIGDPDDLPFSSLESQIGVDEGQHPFIPRSIEALRLRKLQVNLEGVAVLISDVSRPQLKPEIDPFPADPLGGAAVVLDLEYGGIQHPERFVFQ